MLADQVDDHPATVALLDVGQRERGDLRAAQTAAEQDGQDRGVADAFGGYAEIRPKIGNSVRRWR